jgi:uncharacterized small protein (DUF1192 family)
MGYGMNTIGSGDYAAKEANCAGQVMVTSRETTVAQNIDNRIASLREQIARLDAVKQKLSRGTILDVSLEDLQMALGRY